jgi:hypothetical protein
VDIEAHVTPEACLLHGVSKAVRERTSWSAKNQFVFLLANFASPHITTQ